MAHTSANAHKKRVLNILPDSISTFWQQGIFNYFIGTESVKIHYAIFTQPAPKKIKPLVIVPGRVESYLKYQELAFNLYQEGYSVFIIDHRGQGLSDRLLKNPNKGHVGKFQDYIDDFSYFIRYVVAEYTAEKPHLLAHSMGGAIAIRFMQEFPSAIKSAIIASPMITINTGRIPQRLASKLIETISRINKIVSNTPWYFFGQKDYEPIPFTDNKLTHCSQRYQHFVELYKNNKNIQLGGVTTQWLVEALNVKKDIFNKLNQLKTPILVLKAERDKVVCGKAHDLFCQQLHALQPLSCPQGKPIKISGAFHELFFETDDIRNKALQATLNWYQEYQ